MVKLTQILSKGNSLLTSLIYPTKIINLDAILYRHIKFNQISKSTFRPSANNFKDPELSCDWDKYTTPQQSLKIISKQYKHNSKEFKNEKEYFICGIYVKDNLNLNPAQNFLHNPIFHLITKRGAPNNRAHSIIVGDKSEKDALKARGQLAARAKWIMFDEQEFKRLIA
jgi:hypothetical protein